MRAKPSVKTGAAIRKLRIARGWSLAVLSERSGIPLSTLSRVELGQNLLNYDKLVRLCRALEVDLESLMAREAASGTASGRRSVIRANEGAPVGVAGNLGRRAAADLLAKSLSPVIIDVTANNLDAHGPPVVQDGEAYVLVLGGSVEFHNHLYAPLQLAAGDAVYFDAASGYALLARDAPARVLLVVTGEASFAA